MKKLRPLLLIGLAVAMVCSLAACSGTSDQETSSENASDTVSVTSEEATESNSQVSETSSEAASEPISSEAPEKTASAGGSSSGSNTSKNTDTGNQKKTSEKKKETTTNKETTTEKKTTTTVKHVSAKDVQNQINNYIKSKGWSIATDFTLSNSSWTGGISGSQEALDEGYTLKRCKEEVDYLLNEATKQWGMYCYYDEHNQLFYILYSY